MIIASKHFGNIDIPEEEIITFTEGIYGFEEIKEYVLLGKVNDENPFMWLHAIRDPDVCFVVIDPLSFKKDYAPSVNEKNIEKLELEDAKDLRYLSIVVIPTDMSKMTANLKGPILINARKNIALQIILDKEEYKTKHYILEEMQQGA